jgi:hypothetical protein
MNRRAWENLQEIRWVLKDSAAMEIPKLARKTIDLEGRLVKDGVRKANHGPRNRLGRHGPRYPAISQIGGPETVDVTGFGLRARRIGTQQGD